MSIKCQSRVWDHSRQKGSALIILLAIADYAQDDGTGAFPSIERLAIMARMTARQVKRLLMDLEESGELLIERGTGRGNTNCYTVNVWPPVPGEDSAAQPEEERVIFEEKGDTVMSPFKPTEKVTFSPQRVTSGVERVTSGVIKGDIAMSPDPLGSIRDPMIREERARAREAPTIRTEPDPPPPPSRNKISSPEPTGKTVRISSPYLDPRHFANGYIPEGTGASAVEVYYERFPINGDKARLTRPKEDDLIRECPDLERLRGVVVAYSRTTYQPGNIRLVLDWYHNGVPDQHNGGNGNGRENPRNGTAANTGFWHQRTGRAISDEQLQHIMARQQERSRQRREEAGISPPTA